MDEFRLCCKNGDLDKARELYKIHNFTTFEKYLLYDVCDNGNLDMIEWLFKLGIKFKCLSFDDIKDIYFDSINNTTISNYLLKLIVENIKCTDIITNIFSSVCDNGDLINVISELRLPK